MEPFKMHRGRFAVLNRSNIDTDQIIPKQFLKMIGRTGFGQYLFSDWRYLPDGKLNAQFELNAPQAHGASILVTSYNFGCGSSREHAVWAIQQAGFRVVIAPNHQQGDMAIPAFADIFRNNSLKNGLLTIELDEAAIEQIIDLAKRGPIEGTVDLEKQRISIHSPQELSFPFPIDPNVKDHLLRGLDEIGLTTEYDAAIGAFERKHDAQLFASQS